MTNLGFHSLGGGHALIRLVFSCAMLSVSGFAVDSCPKSVATDTAFGWRHAGLDAFGPETLGERSAPFDYTGVRRFSPVPAIGIHPRVYFGPEELPDIRKRLTSTAAGRAASRQITAYTTLLRLGRDGFNRLPPENRTMPDGSELFTNVGLFDAADNYQHLVAGDASFIPTFKGAKLGVLAGEMAMEAFDCLIHQGEPGIDVRAAALAKALDTWAQWAITYNPISSGLTGDMNLPLAYDLNHWAMDETQRGHVRQAIARTLPKGKDSYFGADLAPEAAVGNWITLKTHELINICAVEGETTEATDGVSAATLAAYFKGAMRAQYKFFTYGMYPSGNLYEGMGKNELSAAHQVVFAKRGYDFFGHPHIKKFLHDYAPAIMQPFGFSFTTYDVLGGSGRDPVRGNHQLHFNDVIGLKWAYPDDRSADFLWRNTNTEWKDAKGVSQIFYDYRVAKCSFYTSYWSDLIPAAAFASDFSTSPWAQENAAVQPGLDYEDASGGIMIARSGFDSDAMVLQTHIRQDFGGHTTADRNSFSMSGLGRIWVRVNTGHDSQESQFQSVVLVDGSAMKVTQRDGRKMRIPARLAGWKSAPLAHVVAGDATYAYTNEWLWREDGQLSKGFVPEPITFNDFRRSNNQITESFGHTSMASFPSWWNPGKVEFIQKKPFNPMRQVYRTTGLIRGMKPYALIIDDIRKDDAPHAYKWLAQIPEDLTIITGVNLPAGFNRDTDVVLREPAATGDRQLLVRILRADGTPIQAEGSSGSTLAYLEKSFDPGSPTTQWNRLVIERAQIVAPQFLVMLFPMRAGDAAPIITRTETSFTITIGEQNDLIQFHPRTLDIAGQTVTLSEFSLTRAGSMLIDFRKQFEPMTKR